MDSLSHWMISENTVLQAVSFHLPARRFHFIIQFLKPMLILGKFTLGAFQSLALKTKLRGKHNLDEPQ